MKVLFINGSGHEDGTCARGFKELSDIFDANGVAYDTYLVGNMMLQQCNGCGACAKLRACRYDDIVNEIGSKLEEYDAILVASPVHYASSAGILQTLLDRLFYVYGRKMRGKVYAAFAAARRAGTTATLDQLYKYPLISGMLVPGSQYWNTIHGNSKEDVEQDLEGLQTLRTLANNMIYLMKLVKLGNENGIEYPARERITRTNFIR